MIASILIKANNQRSYLAETFAALSQQSLQDFEVLFLYSGYSPDTLELAGAWGARIVEIDAEEFSHPKAFNLGAEVASGQYLVCLSADAVPAHNRWLEQLIAPLACQSVAGVYGRHLFRTGGNLLDWLRLRRRYRSRPLCKWASLPSQASLLPPGLTGRDRVNVAFGNDHLFSNANSAIRQELWHEHPFDESLDECEDYEWAFWAQQNGFSIAYSPEAAVFHTHGETYGYFRYARRIARFGFLLRSLDRQLGGFDLSAFSRRPCALLDRANQESSPCPWLTGDHSAKRPFSRANR